MISSRRLRISSSSVDRTPTSAALESNSDSGPFQSAASGREEASSSVARRSSFIKSVSRDPGCDHIFVKIGVCDCGKQVQCDQVVYFCADLSALCADRCGHCRESFGCIDKQILHGGNVPVSSRRHRRSCIRCSPQSPGTDSRTFYFFICMILLEMDFIDYGESIVWMKRKIGCQNNKKEKSGRS